MKNYKYVILVFLGMAVYSCSDLEEEPRGLLAPEGFFQSLNDVQTAINGTYGNLQEEAYWGRKFSLPLMLRSDMVSIGDRGTPGRRIDHDEFTVSDDNGMITTSWPTCYQVIATANLAIAGARNVAAEEDAKNAVVAQAYFVRAYMYYHLVRLYGGLPYIDFVVDNIDTLRDIDRTPEDQVYQNIIADLTFAKQWLPDTQPNRTLPSKGAASAYLADVYLTMGMYPEAYNEAKEVIMNKGTYNFDLEPDFQDLFDATKQDASLEPIFVIDFNNFRDGDIGQDYQGALTGIRANERNGVGGGWSVAVPTANVYNNWDSNDYRRDVSFDADAIFGGNLEPFTNFPNFDSRNIQSAYIAKYTRFPGQTANGNGRASETNYAQMRYAEVLLIAAEALNEVSPGTTEADGYVNEVLSRARARDGSSTSASPANVSGLSQTDFRNMIMEERRLELAFEFKRWYDIKRRQLGNEVFGPSGLEPQPNFDPARDYLLPLPADELARLNNINENNPGY